MLFRSRAFDCTVSPVASGARPVPTRDCWRTNSRTSFPRPADCYSPGMNESETAIEASRWHLDIADMTPGTRVEGTYSLVNPQVSASRNGNPFLKCILRDASGRVNARKWSVEPGLMDDLVGATFVHVEGCCENFNDQIQVRVEAIESVAIEADRMRDLLPSSRRDPEEMLSELKEVLGTLVHPAAVGLAEACLADESFMTRFKQAPAAVSMHHAHLGGLLEHTLSLLKSAQAILPFHPELDRDVVLLGLFLHDSGKVLELDPERSGTRLIFLRDGTIFSCLSNQSKEQRAALYKFGIKLQRAGGSLEPRARSWRSFCKLLLQHCIGNRVFLLPYEMFSDKVNDLKGFICGDQLDPRNGGASSALPCRCSSYAHGWSAQLHNALRKDGILPTSCTTTSPSTAERSVVLPG